MLVLKEVDGRAGEIAETGPVGAGREPVRQERECADGSGASDHAGARPRRGRAAKPDQL